MAKRTPQARSKASVGAWKAQRLGAWWEAVLIRDAAIQGISVTRIPDGCKVIGRGKLRRVTSPFDVILHFSGKSVFLDLKRSEASRFSASAVIPHQIEALGKASRGGAAGYLCNLAGQVVFFDWHKLWQLKPGSGLGVADGLPIGEAGAFNLRKLFEI